MKFVVNKSLKQYIIGSVWCWATKFSALNFSVLSTDKNFVTDIKIRHLNNTHVLLQNVTVSLPKLIIFKEFQAKFTISSLMYILH